MTVMCVLMLLGGMGFFLFGMKTISSSIEQISKKKMETIFKKLCGSTAKGLMFGTVVTAVLQSSSAVTVMVVSCVDNGVLSVANAAGIIMGANIGTTVTSVLFGLSQFQFTKLLSTNALIYFFAIVGCIPFMLSKKHRMKSFGQIAMGFSILMMGMESMSNAMKPLADNPKLLNFFVLFQNPLFGIFAGTVITALVQSSSVSVGMLQALSVTGAINYAMAIPIVMGQNIGTCITALLACVGVKPNARTAAFLNLYFNIAGAGILFALLYGANLFYPFSFLSKQVNGWDIAMIHVLFNLISTVIVLPLTKPILHFLPVR